MAMDTGACWGEEFVVKAGEGSRMWANVLANPRYLLRLSGQGRGDSYLLANEKAWPLTKTIEDLDQPDLWPSRQIFIHDYNSNQFWPLMETTVPDNSDFQVRHGAVHTVFAQTEQDISSQTTVLLDSTQPIEFWQVNLKNSSRKKRRLGLFFVVEWALSASDRPRTSWEDNILFAYPRDLQTNPTIGFITLNRQVDSFDGSRASFIGPFGDRLHPLSVIDGKCSRSQANAGASVGVLQKNLALGPLGEASLTLMLGGEVVANPVTNSKLSQTKQLIKKTIHQYCQDKLLEAVAPRAETAWRMVQEKTLVNTPDHQFNHSFNQWLKLQSYLNIHLPQQSQIPELSNDYLSALQGIVNVLPNEPTIAQERLIQLLARQKREGGLINNENNPSADYHFTSAIIRALEETGDQKLAKYEVSYADFGRGSVLEHLSRSLRYRLKKQGESDLLERIERNNSDTYLSDNAQLAINLQQAVPIFTRFDESSAAHFFRDKYDQLKEVAQRFFWQGHWFAFAKVNGKKLGTPKNSELKIFLEAQSWAVLAGFGQKTTQEKALRSVLKRLITQHGPASVLPASTNQSLYPDEEGENENGGIVTSSLAPLLASLAKLGWGDEIEKIWRQTNGLHRYLANPRLVGEPYSYPKFIFGPDSPRFGQESGLANLAQNPGVLWSTLLESVLGIRATIGGLKISPCLPRDWRQVEATRLFRGAQYHFRIVNNFRVCQGIDRIIVDGLRLTGDVIKPYSAGNHYIEIYLG